MPRGVPVGTLAISNPGVVNSALMAASILALNDTELATIGTVSRQTANVGSAPTDS